MQAGLTSEQKAAAVLRWEGYERERAKARTKQSGERFGKGVADSPQPIAMAGITRDALAKRAGVST